MRRRKALSNACFVLIFSFLYLPIAVLIAFSFNESKSRSVWGGFSLKWYENLFHNEMVLKSFGVSLAVAFAAAGIATVLGTLAAIGIHGMSRRARSVVMAISYVPVVNPEIITGVSLMLLFVVMRTGGERRRLPSARARGGAVRLRPRHAADRAHYVLSALCDLQRRAKAAPA